MKERAIGTMARVMVEEHLYWYASFLYDYPRLYSKNEIVCNFIQRAGVMWRFAFGGKDTLQQVSSGEKKFSQWLTFHFIAPHMRSMAKSQGVGRYTETEVKSIMLNDLKAISAILGQNKFLLGEDPIEDDCAVFAGLASAVFTENSPVQNELNSKMSVN